MSNSEVVLGSYRYPLWAHIIGWSIVAIILSPLLKHALMGMINAGIVKVLENIEEIHINNQFFIYESKVDLKYLIFNLGSL